MPEPRLKGGGVAKERSQQEDRQGASLACLTHSSTSLWKLCGAVSPAHWRGKAWEPHVSHSVSLEVIGQYIFKDEKEEEDGGSLFISTLASKKVDTQKRVSVKTVLDPAQQFSG